LPERRRCVFFLTSLTLLFASLQAQEFNAGILFGSNTTQFSSTNVDSGNVSSEAGEGWQVALLMEYFENSYFALQTGLRLSQTSAAISHTFSDSIARSDFESLFLYVPIAMRIASRTNPEVYVTVFGAGGVQLSGRVRGQQQLIDLPPAAFEFGGSGGINYQWGKSIFLSRPPIISALQITLTPRAQCACTRGKSPLMWAFSGNCRRVVPQLTLGKYPFRTYFHNHYP
jgi:hypothetical protein